jgi:hypothetical protein
VIRIVITENTSEFYVERVNFIVKSTPTEIRETEDNSYSSVPRLVDGRSLRPPKTTVKCIEEYKTENVTPVFRCKERIVSTELLEQNVPSDTFDLKAVIKAINGLT